MKRFLAVAVISATAAVLGTVPAAAHEEQYDQVRPPTEAEREAERASAPDGRAKCVNGVAADTYACDGVEMLDHLWLEDLGLSFANDMWGWTDPATGKDYAIVGGVEGTVFVDISEPANARVVGMLPTHVQDPTRQHWRDVKVHDDHAFVVAEQRPHGMQVFDLTRLRTERGTFTEDAHYPAFGSAHNININESTGFAYVVGTDTCAGGLHMVDISEPENPRTAGCFVEHGYIHDTQCVTYRGPDAEHAGREICFNSNAQESPRGRVNRVSIVDVTDKLRPRSLSRTAYPEAGYSHQGWLTPDQEHFLHGDELDEVDRGIPTRTRVFDVSDLDAPRHTGTFDNATTSIDHNIYTERNLAYASNYTSGLRVYSTANVADGELRETGHFDVYPENDNPTFEGGTWSNYPYFKRDVIGVSTMDRGLFVLRRTE